MKVLIGGHKQRGKDCLEAVLRKGHDVVGVLAHPGVIPSESGGELVAEALRRKVPLFQPTDVNDPDVLATLQKFSPDLIVLSGYSQIVRAEFLQLAPKGCWNLHGGKLPEYRGSSPMNWALINGDQEITLSLVQVSQGVDTGEILVERSFPVGTDETITQVQERAYSLFPEMITEALDRLDAGTLEPRHQDESRAGYYPLRFPEDGQIRWELWKAEQIHNRIRALTTPYPSAFTFYEGQRVKLLQSKLCRERRYGEPGRIYLINQNGILVAAQDRCLWIQQGVFEEGKQPLESFVKRYGRFDTIPSTESPR